MARICTHLGLGAGRGTATIVFSISDFRLLSIMTGILTYNQTTFHPYFAISVHNYLMRVCVSSEVLKMLSYVYNLHSSLVGPGTRSKANSFALVQLCTSSAQTSTACLRRQLGLGLVG